MKKLFLLILIIFIAIGGLWVFEGSNGSMHNIIGVSTPEMPKIGEKNIKIEQKTTDLVDSTVVPVIQPSKNMTKKIDPALLGNVPSFNLKDLYSSISDPKIDSDLLQVESIIDKFIKDYKGNVGKLKASELLDAIKKYEAIVEAKNKLMEMSILSKDLDVTNVEANKLYSKVEQKDADFNAKMAFFDIEIMQISDAQLKKIYDDKKTKDLLKYKPFLDDIRKFKKYTLSEEMEKLSIQKSLTASEAWKELHNNIVSTIIFKINEDNYTVSQASSLVYDSDPVIRKAVSDEVGKAFKNNAMTLTMSINSIIKDKKTDDKIRGYATPISQRNLSNGVDDVAVSSLVSTVKANYVQTAQKYYKLKAKLLGLQKLKYSDRLAPMPFAENNDKVINWDDAKNIVIESYSKFSPKMSDIASKFFTNGWIDARLLPSKTGGAYCDTGVPSNHPYILLNYNGKNRDVMTIAHEVGHGIHSMLSYQNGVLMFSPGLTMAETASMFGERLTFNSLLTKTQNNKDKAVLLANKIEGNIGGIINAVAIADFENKIHAASKNGDLSTEDINKIWTDCLTEMYGDTVEIGEFDSYKWAGIPHIFRTPFYYYAYAFSQLTVDSLYDVYDKKLVPDFENKMVEMLSSGSTKKYRELLSPFKLDPLKSDFWQNGINITIKMIDEFEQLLNNDPELKSFLIKPETTNQAIGSKVQISVSPPSQPTVGVNMVSDATVISDMQNKGDTKMAVQITDKANQAPIASVNLTEEQIKKDSASKMNVSSQSVASIPPVSPINNPSTIVVKLPK